MDDMRITRSGRKTLAMCVAEDGVVEVRAPQRCSRQDIDAFVRKHAGWVQKQQVVVQQRQGSLLPERYHPDVRVLYLGETYPVILCASGRGVTFDGEQFGLPAQKSDAMKSAMQAWFKAEARLLLENLALHYADVMGVQYTGIRITSAQRRWGSCSATNSLSFPYRLVCLPMDAVRYIVVHELAHVRQKNHSRAFYQEVQRVLPDYKKRIKLLKAYQNKLPF